jgi:hypothetical protein
MKTWLIGNALYSPGVLYMIIQNIRTQQRFIKENLTSELIAAKASKDGSLDEADFKKITNYYGLAVPAILGEALCTLRGEKMSLQERLACTYQGAFTGLFDDFFDKHQMPDDLLRLFIERPGEIKATNSSERLFLRLFSKAADNFCNKKLTINYLQQVYKAQVESRKQASPGLTPDEIKRITINKGGVSVLFYRSVFTNRLGPEEENALYNMGGLMQLGNDIFDIYKDSLNGIETLMTTATHVNDVRVIFQKMAADSFNAFYHIGYKKRNVKRFLRLISMSLCSRCYVCLDELEKKERQTDNMFSPHQYSRKDLVCDMDKPRNKWRSVMYHIQDKL